MTNDELCDQLDAFLEAIGANKEPTPEMREVARLYRKMFPAAGTPKADYARGYEAATRDAVAWHRRQAKAWERISASDPFEDRIEAARNRGRAQANEQSADALERREHVGAGDVK